MLIRLSMSSFFMHWMRNSSNFWLAITHLVARNIPVAGLLCKFPFAPRAPCLRLPSPICNVLEELWTWDRPPHRCKATSVPVPPYSTDTFLVVFVSDKLQPRDLCDEQATFDCKQHSTLLSQAPFLCSWPKFPAVCFLELHPVKFSGHSIHQLQRKL